MCYEHIYIFIFIFPCNIRMGNELIAWRDGSWRKNRVLNRIDFSQADEHRERDMKHTLLSTHHRFDGSARNIA